MTQSSTAKKGLGKGLGALIPQGSVFTGGRTIVNIEVEKVVPNPRQPRTVFSDKHLEELAESIRTKGIAQPILVRMIKGSYELVAGERRLRAAKKAGLERVPAIIKDFSDQESMELALIENLQREDLNPMDEAEAYARLAAEFSLKQAEIAQKVGKDRSTVSNMMRLLELPEEVKNALKESVLSVGHARALLAVREKDRIIAIFNEIVKNKLSVRDVEVVISGEPTAAPRSKKRKKTSVPRNLELRQITELLTGKLGTKVRLFGSGIRGKIVIDYFSQEDLERLVELISK
ncbi:MAG: ParB/RepB/Spo0J family partition protein [Candidatus Margulisiibacteriota bacterium]|nr:ParB/RepB/Spo0J family partition protein [Candidatus Margulisiibacteriota bacterium]